MAGIPSHPVALLGPVASELRRMQDLADTVQHGTGWLAAQHPGPSLPPLIAQSLQSLDLLAQHLGALSAMMADLAEVFPDDLRIDGAGVLDRLALGSLRARLAGGTAAEPVEEIELF